MSNPKGTSDEAIGRPGPWSETRYDEPGKPVDATVDDPAERAEAQPPSVTSKPVTEADYVGKKK